MFQLLRKYVRPLSFLLAGMFWVLSIDLAFLPVSPALADREGGRGGYGNGVNVILMIGDGMGWEMARSAAIANGSYYTKGKGRGLNMQTLKGYTYATTYGTTIFDGTKFGTGNSALDGTNPLTGASPLRKDFVFKPFPFNPGTDTVTATGGATDPQLGNLVGYDPSRGGPNPWTPSNPGLSKEPQYIKLSYPDSANTASNLYTGVKSFNNAMAVDVFEHTNETILQKAARMGKSTGVVTSVPITHATPGAAVSSVNRRSKYDADYPTLDNILQEAIRPDQGYLPTVMLGGGHPFDHDNTANTAPAGEAIGGKCNYVYIKSSTYKELTGKTALTDAAACVAATSSNPNNRYGYTFLERGPNAGRKLIETARKVDPNKGERLLGLYGARGQAGNLPVSTANGDYSSTGLASFSRNAMYSVPYVEGSGKVPTNDTVRPLLANETDAQFVAREVNENPTLPQLTKAALNVLGKDKDGFWLMVEGGDIDWAAHDNNMDNLIGTVNDFDKSVGVVIDWIGKNGGWEKNVLIVTADHDHYLTLYPEFPSLLKSKGAPALTYGTDTKAAEAGHGWGPSATDKYGWGSHSNRMVPVYYQGEPLKLANYVGKNFISYGFEIPGVANAVDQVHIYQAMLNALMSPRRR